LGAISVRARARAYALLGPVARVLEGRARRASPGTRDPINPRAAPGSGLSVDVRRFAAREAYVLQRTPRCRQIFRVRWRLMACSFLLFFEPRGLERFARVLVRDNVKIFDALQGRTKTSFSIGATRAPPATAALHWNGDAILSRPARQIVGGLALFTPDGIPGGPEVRGDGLAKDNKALLSTPACSFVLLDPKQVAIADGVVLGTPRSTRSNGQAHQGGSTSSRRSALQKESSMRLVWRTRRRRCPQVQRTSSRRTSAH